MNKGMSCVCARVYSEYANASMQWKKVETGDISFSDKEL